MVVWRRKVGPVPVVDLLLGAVLLVGAALTVRGPDRSAWSVADLAVSCAMAALVVFRRIAPRVVVAGFAGGLVVLAVIGEGTTAMWAFVALLIIAFSSAEQLPPRQALVATASLIASGIAYDAALDRDGIDAVVSPLVIIGLPAAAGAVLRRSRLQSDRLASLAQELAAQHDNARAAAVSAERTRIAREVHDVIAHTVGVMIVQAGAAERMLPVDHPAHDAVRTLRQTGKEAMVELRGVVGLLRTPGDEISTTQPGLEDVPALIDAARATTSVDDQVDPTLDLPAGPALTVYRTVQEALTNVQRHAAGAAVRLRIGIEGDRVVVVVEDHGGNATSPTEPPGFGLVGLAERAELYGGTLTSGPRPDRNGWRVRLELPVGEAPLAPLFGPSEVRAG